MQRIRLTTLFLSPLLILILISVAWPPLSSSQDINKKPIDAKAAIAFTVENKDNLVRFFDPLYLQVLLRNNSDSPQSLDIGQLRLRPSGWAGWSSIGSGIVEDIPLVLDDNQRRRVILPPHASIKLSGVDRNATVNTLGKTELHYVLVSRDATISPLISDQNRTQGETNSILDEGETQLTLEIAPSELISSIWSARTPAQRTRVQARFNELLRQAASETADADIRQTHYVDGTFKYAGGYALEFLNVAARAGDPIVRAQAILKFPYAVWAIDELNSFLGDLDKHKPRPRWAANLTTISKAGAEATCISLATTALKDRAPGVRIAGLKVLTDRKARQVFALVKTLTIDPDPQVRAAAQEYLGKFAGDTAAADVIATSLQDKSISVRKQALSAMLHSPKPPPLETIKRAFMRAKGSAAIGLLPLLFEQEDASLPATLASGFTTRSAEERLAIMTAVAGHADSGTLALVKSGLSDPYPAVQRAALMRLLAFPRETAMPLLDAYTPHAPAGLRQIAEAVRQEIQARRLWPFLATAKNGQRSAQESVFPSQNGTTPIVSPDGNWVAYVETGWGRPGGSGGFGSSNQLSISHAVKTSGADDRVVSDMFLLGWLSDSSGLVTARDSFAAITDLNGRIIAEFGEPLEEKYRQSNNPGVDWRNEELRQQFGGGMPHQRYIGRIDDLGFSDGRAYSPDGKWYGPIRRGEETFFLGVDGEKKPVRLPMKPPRFGFRAIWSPSGRYVQFHEDSVWLIFDTQTGSANRVANTDYGDFPGQDGSWSPWSKDGSRLTFLRDGQVWISGPHGENAVQLTFDSTRKAAPTFSRGGRFLAYVTWQADDRLHYPRLGPTDLWVIDTETLLVTRATAPSKNRINSFDWLDDHTLIFDREEHEDSQFAFPKPRSSLRRLSLLTAQD